MIMAYMTSYDSSNSGFQVGQNLDNQNNYLLWIRGNPGKRKIILLYNIINELIWSFRDTTNISFFFYQATNGRINNATAILRDLIYSLIKKQLSLLFYIKR
ncbi:unnamed protein product [Penicillium salamii]|nr:unnamed protein product [Penicillium salamii]CAG7949375.1 unnamed protein product [Penicillium salamii]CAG8236859.1 unnamed protein product [Penicillium salamii]